MSLQVQLLDTGSCKHPEFVVNRGGTFGPVNFPATVAYIEHPRFGRILLDTGYTDDFFAATRSLPERLYAWVTPVTLGPMGTAKQQLLNRGIHSDEIDYVIITHFHGDHVSGLKDFPKAQYIFMDQAYRTVIGWSRWKQVRSGFLKDLLPEDFEKRATSLDTSETRFINGSLAWISEFYDIFGDGSILGIPLPGHAPGHMGLWVESQMGPLLFVADACWHRDQFVGNRRLNPIAEAFQFDTEQYAATIHGLKQIYETETVSIIPCHCAVSLESITKHSPVEAR